MFRLPRNIKSIYDMQKFRDYCLKPYGIQMKPLPLEPKPQQVEQFVDFGVYLQRTEKPLQKDVVAFRLYNNRENITKPELKQYLEKLYGLDIKKIHTLNYMGRVVRNHKGKYKRRLPDYKKAYVQLTQEVDINFQKLEKM